MEDIPQDYGDKTFMLRNGVRLPSVGLGTHRITNYDVLFRTIDYALEAGYRLFDTAAIHSNEKHLKKIFSRLLPKHGLVRDDIFITTKLSPFSIGNNCLYEAFDQSLENLGMDYVDLYLIHFPGTPLLDSKSSKHENLRKESWLALGKLYVQSKVNAIGVSNFSIRHLRQISQVLAVGPYVNQVEWHPYYNQPEMIRYCLEHNMRLQGYNSFGGLSRGNCDLLEDPIVRKVAQRYDASIAQVLLLWSVQRGVAVVPKSTNPYHIRENKKLQFKLSKYDVMLLDSLAVKNQKYSWDASWIA